MVYVNSQDAFHKPQELVNRFRRIVMPSGRFHINTRPMTISKYANCGVADNRGTRDIVQIYNGAEVEINGTDGTQS